MDTFKNLVADWFKYDDAIRKLKIAIRERKTLQQVLNNKIEDFMFKYNYKDLNTQNGRLKTNVKNVYKPINIKEVREIINNNKHLTGEELLVQAVGSGGILDVTAFSDNDILNKLDSTYNKVNDKYITNTITVFDEDLINYKSYLRQMASNERITY
jgi:hypothetical protein